jgi:CRISPR-associated protein Cmr5
VSVHTRSQKLSQEAFDRVAAHGQPNKEYVSFAKKFPALIHTCGLAQAIAFARAKRGQQEVYAEDLATVLNAGGHAEITSAEVLAKQTREQSMSGYLRLSRDAIDAAIWLKRYVESAAPEEMQEGDNA